MRKALFSLLFCMLLAMPAARARENSLFGPLQRGERAALLLVHFGTSHDDTRERTIDAINAKILPIPGYKNTTDQTLAKKLSNESKGV